MINMTYDKCKVCIFSDSDENWRWYCIRRKIDDLKLMWDENKECNEYMPFWDVDTSDSNDSKW